MNTKNQYEEIFGEEIWNTSHDGVTLEANIKETVLAKLAKIKAMNLLAQQEGIVLDEGEKSRVMKASEEYYKSLNEVEIAGFQVTQEQIYTMYEEYALADKVYEHLITDINPEISDDEARTITVQHVLIKTYSLNEEGEKVSYTEQAKREAYERASKVWQLAKKGLCNGKCNCASHTAADNDCFFNALNLCGTAQRTYKVKNAVAFVELGKHLC